MSGLSSSSSGSSFQPDQRVLDKFIPWIEQSKFDPQHARNWAHLYRDEPEAAMCEATFWGVLTDCGVDVSPNADLTGRKSAPDFRCQKGPYCFYMEVTCIRVATATQETFMEALPEGGAQAYRPLNDAIFHECRSKTPQCASLDAPCILAVGTFHYQASVLAISKTFMEWLLTGEQSVGWDFNSTLGRCVGEPYQITSFRSAAFTRMTRSEGVAPARQPISALLVGGLGCKPPRFFGLLHPNPIREFDPRVLDRLPFCRQRIDLTTATVAAEWVQTPNGWDELSA